MRSTEDKVVFTDCLFNRIQVVVDDKASHTTFAKLLTEADADQGFHVPAVWPSNSGHQQGPNCGIYALYKGLLLTHYGENSVPPPRKNHPVSASTQETELKTAPTSLRKQAKQKSLSAFGAIFDVNHFSQLTDKGCKLDLPQTEAEYIDAICTHLQSNSTVIIACALPYKKSFPNKGPNLTSHWALIFGWISYKNEIHFLVSQYFRYYLWRGKDLFLSNASLGFFNPAFGIYHKRKKDYYDLVNDKSYDQNRKIYFVKELTHADFSFKGFSLPLSPAIPILNDQKIISTTFKAKDIKEPQNLKKFFPKVYLESELEKSFILRYLEANDLKKLKILKDLFTQLNTGFTYPDRYAEKIILTNPAIFTNISSGIAEWIISIGADPKHLYSSFFITEIRKMSEENISQAIANLIFKLNQLLPGSRLFKSQLICLRESLNFLLLHKKFDLMNRCLPQIKENPLLVEALTLEINSMNQMLLEKDSGLSRGQLLFIFSNTHKKMAVHCLYESKIDISLKKDLMGKIFNKGEKYSQVIFLIKAGSSDDHFINLVKHKNLIEVLIKMSEPKFVFKLNESHVRNYLTDDHQIELFLKLINICERFSYKKINSNGLLTEKFINRFIVDKITKFFNSEIRGSLSELSDQIDHLVKQRMTFTSNSPQLETTGTTLS